MRSLSLTGLFVATLFGATIVSCGSKTEGADTEKKSASEETSFTETKTGDFATDCSADTKISVSISDYKFQAKEKIKYEAANFEVKQATWKMKNDSSAELSLCNYTNEERAAGRTDEQVEIKAKFNTKKGAKIGKGVYNYMDYESNMYSQVTIITNMGTVWFNGNDQGNAGINYSDKDHVCGTFDLKVDKPDVATIGTVKLSGTFKVENK